LVSQLKNDELITELVEQDVASGSLCERFKFTKKGIALIRDLLLPKISSNQNRKILQFLSQHHNQRVVTYKDLINCVWNDDDWERFYSPLSNKLRFFAEYCLLSKKSINYEHLTDPRKIVSLSKVGVVITDHFSVSWFPEDEQPFFLQLRKLRDLAPAIRFEVYDRILEITDEYLDK